jgi:hypothetical protein
MTGEEIIDTVGAGMVKRSERQKYQGAYSDLWIPHVMIGPHSFKVIFQMNDETNCLNQVLLSYVDSETTNPKNVFDAAHRVLTERFGRPERVGTSDSWQWAFETTHIDLSALYIPSVVSGASIRFFPAARPKPHIVAAF